MASLRSSASNGLSSVKPIGCAYMGCGTRRAPDVVVPASNHQDYLQVRQEVASCPSLPLRRNAGDFPVGAEVSLNGHPLHLLGVSVFNTLSAAAINFRSCRQVIAKPGSALPAATTLGAAGFGKCVSVHMGNGVYRGPQLTLPVSGQAQDAGLIVGERGAVLAVIMPKRAELYCFGTMSDECKSLREREPAYETFRKHAASVAPSTYLMMGLAAAALAGAFLAGRRVPSRRMLMPPRR